VNQFNAFEPLPNHYINGTMTVGENIADLGGVKFSYQAYKKFVADNGDELGGRRLISHLSNDQSFYVLLAQTWCEKWTDAALEVNLATETHSPGKYRVNGALSNSADFATAFSCAAGKPMNRAQQRCEIW
jgi:endothelin-converting enzyme/putative endopeptidase